METVAQHVQRHISAVKPARCLCFSSAASLNNAGGQELISGLVETTNCQCEL